MNHSQPLNAHRHSELKRWSPCHGSWRQIPVFLPCLVLGTGKDTETTDHSFPFPHISGRLIPGSQDSPYKKKKIIPLKESREIAHSLEIGAAKFHPGRKAGIILSYFVLYRSWDQPFLVRPSQLPRMQLWATPRWLQRIQGDKTQVCTHLPEAIYFTVNFFCPNNLIHLMTNNFWSITFQWKGWPSLPYLHAASKLISRDGPSAHLPLASCHLHPSTPHPAQAPKDDRHRVYSTGRFPSKDHKKEHKFIAPLVLLKPSTKPGAPGQTD